RWPESVRPACQCNPQHSRISGRLTHRGGLMTRKLVVVYISSLLVAVLSVLSPIPLPAADPSADLNALLKANAYPFRIADGRLSGSGAALLEARTEGVQFVAFGEEHNRRAVHKLAGALFHLLRDRRGFQYVALEEDPFVGEMLSTAARSGGLPSVLVLAKRYPNAFHMYTEEEFAFIADAGKTSTAPTIPIWGLNQVFGATHIYDRLVALAPNEE